MTRIDFHYVPTSGDLSGASFEKQTETAFNELGAEIDQIDSLANKSLEVSHTALETSNKALTQAQEADTRSQEALEEAKDAQEKANNASIMSDEATQMAKRAYDTSLIADANAHEAQTKSDTAILTADEAQITAEKALNTANDAQYSSTSAMQLAGQAFDHAANGIPLWDERANYTVPSVCYGRDNTLYEALLSSGPDTLLAGSVDEYVGAKNPVENPDYWLRFDDRKIDIPVASPTQSGAVPKGGKERQIYVVTVNGEYAFTSMDTLLATPSLSGFVPNGGKEGQILGIRDGVLCWIDRYELCEFYFWRHPTLKPGFMPAHGGLLENAATLYPEAWAYLQSEEGQLLCTTEPEWQAMTRAIWHTNADGTQIGWNGIGGAPFYVLDNNTGTLRLPDLRGMYAEVAGFDYLGVGGVHGDGMRNLHGAFGMIRVKIHNDYRVWGAFGIHHGEQTPDSGGGGTTSIMFDFNSARVVPVAAKNQPRAYGVLACAYLGSPR